MVDVETICASCKEVVAEETELMATAVAAEEETVVAEVVSSC